MIRVLTIIAAAVAFAGAARAGGIKTVSDWTGVCSNLEICAAFGFAPEDSDTDIYLRVDRAAGPGAAPSVLLVLDPGDAQPSATWTFALDGTPVAGVGPVRAAGSQGGARARLSGPSVRALVEAMRSGKSLSVLAAGKPVGAVSLAGSAAVLLWVDDQQGRVGTVTALVRPGPRPASSVPPAPPKPVVVAAAPVSQAGLPKFAPKSLIKDDSDCDLSNVTTPDDIVARLSPGVVLWGPECQLAAYNEINIFFLGDAHAGHLKPLSFPEAPAADGASDDELMNANFDPKAQTMSMFAKGRGPGDCGEIATWVWDGKAFRLASELTMPVCRGAAPDDWTALYEARVR